MNFEVDLKVAASVEDETCNDLTLGDRIYTYSVFFKWKEAFRDRSAWGITNAELSRRQAA